MSTLGKKPGSLVGSFLRSRRESVKLSQRQLGLRFKPPVTTQFISNLERGVTPLPAHHIPTLTKELQLSEAELLSLLEREYAQKINDRIHREPKEAESGVTPSTLRSLVVQEKDAEFIRAIYHAYSLADPETQRNFVSMCEKILRVRH
ncbi:XRE family transcriptional regulator [bacterium]|nr:XRE family transcriptional regulator [bacterium]